jgi:DNA-binding CsgD family transcriptional regulator
MSRIKYIGHQQELDHIAGSYPLTWAEMINDCEDTYNAQIEILREAGLTQRQVECVGLKYLSKRSLREIAIMLSISKYAVETHIKRGKAKLVRHLAIK